MAALLKSEQEMLHFPPGECSIHRAPKRLRQLHENAYTPHMVSIGPIHHGRKELEEMEEYKRRYLRDFLERADRASLDDFMEVIRQKEEMLRSSYAETIELTSDDFVKMILIDAAFVIEVLLMSILPTIPLWDRVFSNPAQIYYVKDDIFMLENQLPFFILEDLFTLAEIAIYSNEAERLSFLQIAYLFCREYLGSLGFEETLDEGKYSTVEHILDFLKISILPCNSQVERRPEFLNVPSITKLHQAGVKFKLASNKNMFQLRFRDGILEIPKITVDSTTGFVLQNLLTFEQRQSYESQFNDYVLFLNYLVKTPEDGQYLVQKRIIEDPLGSEQAVSFIHKLARTAVRSRNFYFSSLVEDLNEYCRSPWRKLKATLKQDYFNSPWASVTFIAAVILLILTVIKAVSSIQQAAR